MLERLLINLILTMYDAGQTTSNEEKRNKAKQRDFSLLMFGLLDKYRHTEVEMAGRLTSRQKSGMRNT